jgi:hypothetical protein
MSAPSRAQQVVAAIDKVMRNGGSAKEIVAMLMALGGTAALFEDRAPRPKAGRPRKYPTDAARYRAYRRRKKGRHETGHETPADEERHETEAARRRSLAMHQFAFWRVS